MVKYMRDGSGIGTNIYQHRAGLYNREFEEQSSLECIFSLSYHFLSSIVIVTQDVVVLQLYEYSTFVTFPNSLLK